MNASDALENGLARLAADRISPPDPGRFNEGVWREIRHRRALHAHVIHVPWWQAATVTFGKPGIIALAASLAIFVGVSLGIFHTTAETVPNLASRHLDLDVFSCSAVNLPNKSLVFRQ